MATSIGVGRVVATRHDDSVDPVGRIVVVGGGITGLAAAWHARRLAAEAGRSVDIVVLEAGDRIGGKVHTVRRDGWVIEAAPDSFLTTKPWARDLALALGLGDRLVSQRPGGRRVFVLHDGALVPLPAGFRLAAPTDLGAFLRTPLVSWPGKLRALLDLVRPARREEGDESMADFVRRRMGREVLERLAAPLMAGIHVGDPERLSIEATFPQLAALERRHGSLIRGLRRSATDRPKDGAGAAATFASLSGGVGDLVDALATDLGGIVRTRSVVARIARDGRVGAARDDHTPFTVTLADGSTIGADAVIVATPGPATARLIADVAPEAARIAGAVRHVSSATVSLGYRRDDVAHPLDGLGIIVPRSEGVRWLACSWSSSKWDGRAPDGHVLVRLFYGGDGRESEAELDEGTLVEWAKEDAGAVLGATGAPVIAHAFRWVKGNPQYDVGHEGRVNAAAAACPAALVLAGATWRGVGVPDCVRQAIGAAETVLGAIHPRSDGQSI